MAPDDRIISLLALRVNIHFQIINQLDLQLYFQN